MGEWQSDIAEVDAATERLVATLAELDDDDVRGPSLCAGWSRGHVIAHIAGNAQGMRNLVHWARTGVETPMYPSREARNAAIERDAARPAADHRRDIATTAAAFMEDLHTLREDRLATVVSTQPGREFSAAEIPWRRLREVEMHHVDLAARYAPGDWPAAFAARCLNDVAVMFAGRDDVPPVTVRAGGQEWRLGDDGTDRRTVSGPESSLLAWLSGRGLGKDLTVTPHGPLPEIPAWL